MTEKSSSGPLNFRCDQEEWNRHASGWTSTGEKPTSLPEIQCKESCSPRGVLGWSVKLALNLADICESGPVMPTTWRHCHTRRTRCTPCDGSHGWCVDSMDKRWTQAHTSFRPTLRFNLRYRLDWNSANQEGQTCRRTRGTFLQSQSPAHRRWWTKTSPFASKWWRGMLPVGLLNNCALPMAEFPVLKLLPFLIITVH